MWSRAGSTGMSRTMGRRGRPFAVEDGGQPEHEPAERGRRRARRGERRPWPRPAAGANRRPGRTISSETVKPMPERAAPPRTCPGPTPSRQPCRGAGARPRGGEADADGLADRRAPMTTPQVTGEARASSSRPPRRSTPALASANNGHDDVAGPGDGGLPGGARSPRRRARAAAGGVAERWPGATGGRRGTAPLALSSTSRRGGWAADQQSAKHAGYRGVEAGLEGREPEDDTHDGIGTRCARRRRRPSRTKMARQAPASASQRQGRSSPE